MIALRGKSEGFTLLETLLAAMILCSAILVIGAISSKALNNARLNRQYERALQLADTKLTVIQYEGVDTFLESGQTEGEFSDTQPQYSFKVAVKETEIDNLYDVSVKVGWLEHNKAYDVVLDTRMSSTNSLAQLMGQ